MVGRASSRADARLNTDSLSSLVRDGRGPMVLFPQKWTEPARLLGASRARRIVRGPRCQPGAQCRLRVIGARPWVDDQRNPLEPDREVQGVQMPVRRGRPIPEWRQVPAQPPESGFADADPCLGQYAPLAECAGVQWDFKGCQQKVRPRIAQPVVNGGVLDWRFEPLVPLADGMLRARKERHDECVVRVAVVPVFRAGLHYPKEMCGGRKPPIDREYRGLPVLQ